MRGIKAVNIALILVAVYLIVSLFREEFLCFLIALLFLILGGLAYAEYRYNPTIMALIAFIQAFIVGILIYSKGYPEVSVTSATIILTGISFGIYTTYLGALYDGWRLLLLSATLFRLGSDLEAEEHRRFFNRYFGYAAFRTATFLPLLPLIGKYSIDPLSLAALGYLVLGPIGYLLAVIYLLFENKLAFAIVLYSIAESVIVQRLATLRGRIQERKYNRESFLRA